MSAEEKKALRLLATRLYHTAAIGMKLNACDWSKVIKVAKELEALGNERASKA